MIAYAAADEEEGVVDEEAAAAAAAAAATSGWSAFAKKAQRTLFGWMTSRIKVGGVQVVLCDYDSHMALRETTTV